MPPPFLHPLITDDLYRTVTERIVHRLHGIHGFEHWQRVEQHGWHLARHVAADTTVISFFALLHDARRWHDGFDPEHGPRAAAFAAQLHAEGRLPLTPEQLTLLQTACRDHTHVPFTDDPTIACCWDADRLDLTRIRVLPKPHRLNTAEAKRIARELRAEATPG
jgi:uncharacterized protein